MHYFDGSPILNNNVANVDLYIIDNCLPGIDGIALTKYLRIKHETRESPILIMSGNLSVRDKTRKAGASAFIAKPFEVSLFVNVVQKLLTDHSFTYLPSTIEEAAQRWKE